MGDDHDAVVVRVVTIIVLGAIVLASVAGLTVVAVFTDRDLFRAETMTVGLAAVVATLGGLSWAQLRRRRRRRWHVEVDRGDENPGGDDPSAEAS